MSENESKGEESLGKISEKESSLSASKEDEKSSSLSASKEDEKSKSVSDNTMTTSKEEMENNSLMGNSKPASIANSPKNRLDQEVDTQDPLPEPQEKDPLPEPQETQETDEENQSHEDQSHEENALDKIKPLPSSVTQESSDNNRASSPIKKSPSRSSKTFGKKASHYGPRNSVALRHEVSDLKNMIKQVLERPTGDFNNSERRRGLIPEEKDLIFQKFKVRDAQRTYSESNQPVLGRVALQKHRILKLRTHKTIPRNTSAKRKAPPLPETPKHPDPFRKLIDQQLDSKLLVENLMIIKKQVRYDTSLGDSRILMTPVKPPPSRKGPYYQEPFISGTPNARLSTCSKTKSNQSFEEFSFLDDDIPTLEDEKLKEPVQEYLQSDFKSLIQTGGFYPCISYTPECVLVYQQDSLSIMKNQKKPSSSKSSKSITGNFPKLSSKHKNVATVFSEPVDPPKRLSLPDLGEQHTMVLSPYFISYYTKDSSKKPTITDENNLIRMKPSPEASNIQLPALKCSKKNPLQAILTGKEMHGKMRQEEFRFAFYRDYDGIDAILKCKVEASKSPVLETTTPAEPIEESLSQINKQSKRSVEIIERDGYRYNQFCQVFILTL